MSERAPLTILSGLRQDFGWFVAPGVLAAAAAVLLGALRPADASGETGVGLWILGVLLVDVAHVWSSLYRTYLDPLARRTYRSMLIGLPLACFGLGVALHLHSPITFWSVLAYVAIFHFIKQHVGFAMIYVRAGGESRFDRRVVEAAVWAGTAGPVLWWHAHLPTRFVWFMPGDLLTGAPAWLGTVALLGQLPIWLVFIARRVALFRAGRGHPLVPWLVLVPALNWHLGIVVYDSDEIFTITNVFLHGIPYLALVWVAGGRQRVVGAIGRRSTAAILATYYGIVAALALVEETLWDRLVWHDQPQLFGQSATILDPESLAMAVIVSLLTVPQATHYVLDRYIWRVGPNNPRLAAQLGLSR